MPTPPNDPTTSLYFAFGTNLSPTQISLRCTASPSSPPTPLAIARLPHWKWFIQRRGCANIKPSPRDPHSDANATTAATTAADDEVWGLLYSMHAADIAILDTYEGVDPEAPAARAVSAARPREQGRGRHNKLFLEVEVVRWVDGQGDGGAEKVRAMVYVDEGDVGEGVVREDYVGRMNRGVREAVGLGLSEEWVEGVVRRWVVAGVEAEEGYVGGENRGLEGGG